MLEREAADVARRRRSATRAVAWSAVLALALALRLVTWGQVVPDARSTSPLFDGDSQYHRLRAEQLAEDYPHVAWRDPLLGDGGIDVPWPPLFDLLVATTALAVGGGEAVPADVARAAAWAPVAIGVATVLLVGWLAALLVGSHLALGVALLFALSTPHAVFSLLGRSDQHVLELFLTTAILIAFAKGLRARGRLARSGAALALGLAITLAFWNWLGSALNLCFLALFVAAWHLLAPRRSPRCGAPAAVLAGGCGIAAALLVASVGLLGPAGALSRWDVLGVTGLHVLITAGTGASATLLWAGRRIRPDASRGRRLAEVLVAGILPLLAAAAFPGPQEGIRHGLQALLRGNPWYASIAEFTPVLFGGYQPLDRELVDALGWYGLAPVLAAAGAAAVTHRWRSAAVARPELLLLATWGGSTFVLAIARHRFALYAAPALAIYAWLGIRYAQERWLPGLARGLAGAAFVGAAVAAAVGPPVLAFTRHSFEGGRPSPGPLLAWIRDRVDSPETATVYARWEWGHHVRAIAHRPAVASPFGTEGGAAGFEESLRTFLSTDEAAVEQVLRARRAGYFLVEDPRKDVLSYQYALAPDAPRLALVSSSWRTGRTMIETEHYRRLVAYRLHALDGSSSGALPTLGGFRLLRETVPADPEKSDRPAFMLFGVVAGARLGVSGAAPGSEVEATTVVRTNTGREFTWRASARADAEGRVELRVPYARGENGSSVAGPYEVASGALRRRVDVAESAIVGGQRVAIVLPSSPSRVPREARLHAPR